MRSMFFETLRNAMREDQTLFFLTGDMGYNLVESMFKEFPDRALNIGIAEQNMIGIAAGLCNVGFKPICYTISNFLVHRCLEQIRNDICLHNYPILLVGTSAGFDNGGLGPTHHVIDDIGCLKPLPGMHIYSPSSLESMQLISHYELRSTNRAYIRIPKTSFSEGKTISMINHYALEHPLATTLIITHGKILPPCLSAAKSISFPVSVYAMDIIKPFNATELIRILRGYHHIFVAEDHFNDSGLFNSLCEFITEHQLRGIVLYPIGITPHYEERIGDVEYLERKNGLYSENICRIIKEKGE